MTPLDLAKAAAEISQRWPDAVMYVNPPAAPNGYVRNPGVPAYVLTVDVDRVWPHECDDDDDCSQCYGYWDLVAWIDSIGKIHYTELAGNRP